MVTKMAESTTRRTRPKAWMRATEQANRLRQPDDKATAVRVFRNELDRNRQFELAAEIAETRTAELCRAYANVIDIGAGYRTRHDAVGARKARRQVAVIFFVSRKWATESERRAADAIPSHLYTYVTIDDRRLLCAIPTDVRDANEEGEAEIQSRRGLVEIQPSSGKAELGTPTCLIRRSVLPNAVYAIGCRHAFSITRDHHSVVRNFQGDDFQIWKVADKKNHDVFGRTQKIRGELRNGPDVSLDAQLCKVDDMAVLRRLLGPLRIDSVAESAADLTDRMAIVTVNGRIPVKQFEISHRSLPYGRSDLQHVVHRSLIATRYFAGKTTQCGDSGAPLVSTGNPATLIGMHIARSEDGTVSYAIPAWHFLNPKFYKALAKSSEFWTIVNSV
jgi:hypothetical protein